MKHLIPLLFIVLGSVSVYSQNITVKLIDANTKKSIPYANIKTGDYSGVISNEEGYFTLHDVANDAQITISCLGYKNKNITVKDIKSFNFIIALEESINELNTVYISAEKPNADDIVSKARQHLSKNYDSKLYKHEVFSRETAYMDFNTLNFDIEKTSHVKKQQLESANKSLDSLSKAIINSKTKHFKDFKADLYMDDSLKTKLVVQKATELIDQKNNLSIEDVQKRAQDVILKYLDTTITYKLKTGLFKIEDSLSLNEKEDKKTSENEYNIKNLKEQTTSLLKRAQFYNTSFASEILDADLYEYSFQDISYFNDDLIYVINYKPRRYKAKYTGKLFIADSTYAITKVDFKYADGKRGQKVNLKLILGVKYIENMRRGTIIYQKDSVNKYQPHYIKFEEGRYFYVSRPLKFIENSPEKNKTSFDFTIEGDILTKQELLLTSNSKISLDDFKKVTEDKNVPYVTLHSYDASIWKQDQTLEPSTEMKEFKGED
ncbi:carboxypeptidase-like regulatory domain-containing protein [Yeosuana marina]|uniref:carboxypeptidase-like regulatory domain-containing protein n=1 Tax=Yeosuana marina TaxID=1565536 RepID=UPI001423A8DA|nr:carboxypeptidase-like regulatory domain-containing protein [Yeosuana marina]